MDSHRWIHEDRTDAVWSRPTVSFGKGEIPLSWFIARGIPQWTVLHRVVQFVPYVNKIKMYVFHTILWHELSNSWINTAWRFWGWTRVNGLFSVLGLICRSWIEQLQNAVPKRGKKWETDLLLREVGEWCCNTAKRNRGAVWTRVKCGHGVLFYLIIQMEEFSTKINW